MEALENAIKIIKNEKRDPNYNTLYLFTNENLNELTNNLSLNNKKVITVCSSGDQFFNFLVKHPKDIMLYDINPLTEYLFYLKKAAIENLDYDTFKDFLLDKKLYNKYLLSKDIYQKIKEDIPDKIKYFWDELYKKYDNYQLYNSNLFYTIRNSPKSILNNNNYLKDEHIYYKLRVLLKKITEIKYYNINIFEEFLNENNKFDFIYVSNILDYLNIDNEKEYYIKLKKIITKLSNTLNTNGEIGLNYIFNYLDELWYKTNHYLKRKVQVEYYLSNKKSNYKLINLSSGISYKSKRIEDKDALLIYKKQLFTNNKK